MQPLASSWERALNQDVVLVKTDHELNAANRITLRYNHQNFTGEGFEAGGAQNALEHTGASLVQDPRLQRRLDQRRQSALVQRGALSVFARS